MFETEQLANGDEKGCAGFCQGGSASPRVYSDSQLVAKQAKTITRLTRLVA
jgi:hypothetical protein